MTNGIDRSSIKFSESGSRFGQSDNGGYAGASTVISQNSLAEVRRRRIAAFIVDFVIISILCSIATVVIAFIGIITLGLGWLLYTIFVPAIALAYAGFTLGGEKQATPGMRMFDVHIERNDGRPVDFWLAVVYVAIFWVTLISLFVLAVSLFTSRKELLQDLLLGTVVVRD